MSGLKNMRTQIRRGAVLPTALAWVGLMGASTALMQLNCPLLPPVVEPVPVEANAGADVSLLQGNTTTLAGSATGGTGSYTFSWVQTGGPTQTLVNGGTASPSVSATGNAGDAVFTLTATDSDGVSDTDTVTVTVTAPDVPEPAELVANAGADATVEVGQTVQLMGSATGGTNPLGFQWTQLSGPVQSIVPAFGNAQNLTVVGTTAGTAVFELLVTDSLGETDTDTATVTVTPGTTGLVFTTGTDNLVGTANADTFTSVLAAGGLQTLNTGDTANGMGEVDTLLALIVDGTARPALTSIEILEVTVGDGAAGINASQSTGITHIMSIDSVGDLDVTNLAALVDVALMNPDAGADLILGFNAPVLAGDADELTADISGVTGGGSVLEINNGLETLNINSTGGEDNILEVDAGGDLVAINVLGDSPIDLGDIGANNAGVETLDASGSSGGVTAELPANDVTVMGSSGDDDFTFNAGDTTVTGGAGDDTATFAAGEFNEDDTVDLGDGTADRLNADADDLDDFVTSAGNVTGVEQLGITDAADGTINATFFGSINEVVLTMGAAAGFDLTVANNTTVTVEADSAGAQTYAVAGNGTTDVLSMILDDADLAGVQTFTGVETGNIESTGDANTTVGLTFAPSAGVAGSSLNITGDEDLTIGATNATVINASGLDGDFTMAANPTAGAANISGGAGDDTLLGTAGNDSITGNAGDDVIRSNAGNDSCTGGDGDDTFEVGHDVGTTADLVNDFLDSGDDVLGIDLSELNGAFTDVVNGAGNAAVADGDDADFGTFASGATLNAAATDNIFIVTDTTGINAFADIDLSGGIVVANNTAAGDAVILMFYDADGGEAVIGALLDADSNADATFNATNSAFFSFARITMTPAEYTALTVDSFDFIP